MIFINVMTPQLRSNLRNRRYKERHPDRIREQRRIYHQTHLDKHRAYTRTWAKNNRDKVKAAKRQWEKSHPEPQRRRQRKYDLAHREDNRIRGQKWKKANKDKVNASTHRRRARKRGVEWAGHYTDCEWQTLKRQYGHHCVCCWRTEKELNALGLMLSPDHIVPLSKSGLNHLSNLQPLCHSYKGSTVGCNNSKGATYIDFVIS